MSGAHTAGPWSIHPVAAYVVPIEHVVRPIGGAEDPAYDLATYAQAICAMHHPDPHRSEREVEANARLIAAAPDMLEALSRAMKWLAICDDVRCEKDFDFAEAALARAKGTAA